jgi:RNA polymerase sigma factor (sigma-70 family)
MEASALHAPPSIQRLTLSGPLLRLRSDEQLVALFRAGSEDAFAVIHDRYKQRLFAYVRQMLSSSSRADAEDVLQDVFVRAYGALRNDARDINLRAWLYRVAHNRCIDHFRRPTPAAADLFDMSRTPLHDPIETAQRREDLQRLVDDVGRLPDQQRSALLMREIDGVAYADIAVALDVTVPAVKSLLVRARVGLTEAIEARDTDCAVIRDDLVASYDRGVKASGRARKHMRECSGCREFRTNLRTLKRSFAALSPLGAAGPIALLAKALGMGGAGGGAAAGGGAVGGGGAAIAGTATACKVAAVVCTAALATGGAVEVKHLTIDRPSAPLAAKAAAPRHAAPRAATAALSAPATVSVPVLRHRTEPAAAGTIVDKEATEPKDSAAPITATDPATPDATVEETLAGTTGGAVAPVADTVEETTPADTSKPASESPSSSSGSGASQNGSAEAPAATDSDAGQPASSGGTPSSDGPPPEH